MRNTFGLLAVTTFLLSACGSTHRKDPAPDFLAQNIDTAISPASDFFSYANGAWIKNTPIPSDESAWTISQLVEQDIYLRLRKINEEAAAAAAPQGSITQKIGDLWHSGMDSSSIDKLGLSPLRNELKDIDDIHSSIDLIRVSASLHKKGIEVLFAGTAGQDDRNSDKIIYQLSQGGLGMSRDYYFSTAENYVQVRDAYKLYLARIFQQLGLDSAAAQKTSASVFQLETRLAKASRSLEDTRDPFRNYNKMNFAALQKLTPALDWKSWLQFTNVGHIDSLVIRQPEFFAALNTELSTTSIEDWKSYCKAHLIMSSAPYLDKETYTHYFDYHRTLSGTTTPRPRWKRVLDAEDNLIGEALGQLFVKEYFSETAKQRYGNLVESIRTAFRQRIEKLSWMSDSTKQKAIGKLSLITKKVGYPDKWKDFSKLKIDRGPYVLNVQRAFTWWYDYTMSKLGRPVDRTDWDMSPQTYNAYYNPSNNEIVLPAGIFLVPGKKVEDLDEAFIYGYSAASTIGHEITHGFDDQGRLYDEKGNLHNWWQPADESQFTARAAGIIKQYSEFSPVDTLHINGRATQGENIADLGGLLLGLDAFKQTGTYKNGHNIGGLTPIQRFFVGYAYSYIGQERKESLATSLLTDEHSPYRERVNGPVVNVPEFYEAFNVKPGDKMYRPDSLRVSIW